VRNTDINFFMRLRPDLNSIARQVLTEAGRVIFLSPAYREALLARLDTPLRQDVQAKAAVIPNGLSALWLEDWTRPARGADTPLRLLHVGDLSANKNVAGILRAAALLHSRRPVQLTLVGGSGARAAALRRELAASGHSFVNYLGKIDDGRALRDVYRTHDILVMPSFRETFGIVYIEALSQGLPVIHSKGQGIDGFFAPGTVSQAVDPNDIQDIAQAAEALIERHETSSPLCMAKAKEFSWELIARSYDELYRSILR
jgi:glycosyltransferase involved in cell wall biosynthesis